MSNRPDDDASNQPPKDPNLTSQEFQHTPVGARVPEKVGRGVFSTGVLVLQGAHEFVLDFVQGMVQPRQLVARVLLPPSVVPSLLNALRENLNLYQNQFGPPPALRQPTPPPTPPSIEEIYSQFKVPDDMLSGIYANAAMIVHTQGEFCLDFITNFYPRSAVSCRVYLAAPQVPSLLNTLTHSFQQFQQKLSQQQGKPPQLPPPSAS
jgi:hypothetical protein